MGTMDSSGAMIGPGTILAKTGRWLTLIGVVFLVLGLLAIIEPVVAGLAVAILVGWLLIFGGVAHAVEAFGGGGAARVFWQLLLAVLYLVGGLYLVSHPLMALGTLTLFLAAILLAETVVEVVSYVATRGESGSRWHLVNAIVTLLLGGMIWSNWPTSSAWAIGTIVGVNLMITGLSRLMLGSAARKLAAAA